MRKYIFCAYLQASMEQWAAIAKVASMVQLDGVATREPEQLAKHQLAICDGSACSDVFPELPDLTDILDIEMPDISVLLDTGDDPLVSDAQSLAPLDHSHQGISRQAKCMMKRPAAAPKAIADKSSHKRPAARARKATSVVADKTKPKQTVPHRSAS